MVDIGAEHDRAQRTHQESGAESHECQQERRKFIARRKKRFGDIRRIKTEQKKIEHFQKISARDPQHRRDFGAGASD